MLVDKLEEKMKGTSVEGTMAHLFRGKFSNYVRCIAVDDRSGPPSVALPPTAQPRPHWVDGRVLVGLGGSARKPVVGPTQCGVTPPTAERWLTRTRPSPDERAV